MASFMIGPHSKGWSDCILAYPSGVPIRISRPFALDTVGSYYADCYIGKSSYIKAIQPIDTPAHSCSLKPFVRLRWMRLGFITDFQHIGRESKESSDLRNMPLQFVTAHEHKD